MVRRLDYVLAAIILASTLAAAIPVRADPAQDIRDLDERWVAMIAARDAESVAGLYAPDGYFMPPNAPAIRGHDGIKEAWQGLISLPGLALSFTPDEVAVSASGDMAADIGSYSLAFDGDQGRVKDQGKYVVVWKKVDGHWRVKADIFNSNLAAQ